MHENYKELIQLLYLIAERKGDTATLRMMEDIFIGDATYP